MNSQRLKRVESDSSREFEIVERKAGGIPGDGYF